MLLCNSKQTFQQAAARLDWLCKLDIKISGRMSDRNESNFNASDSVSTFAFYIALMSLDEEVVSLRQLNYRVVLPRQKHNSSAHI